VVVVVVVGVAAAAAAAAAVRSTHRNVHFHQLRFLFVRGFIVSQDGLR
jgi:type II secretory pathway pseudopilin PulG